MLEVNFALEYVNLSRWNNWWWTEVKYIMTLKKINSSPLKKIIEVKYILQLRKLKMDRSCLIKFCQKIQGIFTA